MMQRNSKACLVDFPSDVISLRRPFVVLFFFVLFFQLLQAQQLHQVVNVKAVIRKCNESESDVRGTDVANRVRIVVGGPTTGEADPRDPEQLNEEKQTFSLNRLGKLLGAALSHKATLSSYVFVCEIV